MAAVSMYSIGICDDDKVLCAGLEEMVYRVAEKLSVKVEVEVWYSGESLLADLKKGTSLELLFLDIELVRQNGVAVGTFIREEMEDLETHIVYISGKESYAMQLFRVQKSHRRAKVDLALLFHGLISMNSLLKFLS